jgi:hypothetical protein
MSRRRDLLHRLRKLATGPLGWHFEVEHFTDEFGHEWERHIATSPNGVRSAIELPTKCATTEEWLEFVRARGWPKAHPTIGDMPATPPGANGKGTLH